MIAEEKKEYVPDFFDYWLLDALFDVVMDLETPLTEEEIKQKNDQP